MSKPATKEPSMDEILSSIRQIIADDDAASVAKPAPVAAKPEPAAPEPLVLSPAQMVPMPPPAAPAPPKSDFSAIMAGLDAAPVAMPEDEDFSGEPELVDPEDVAFEAEIEPEPVRPVAIAAPPPPPAPMPVARVPEPPPRPIASVAHAAPMPDPTLSSDMAEQLLAPAAEAAARGAMARLGEMGNTGIGAMTVEAMIRDMLRPMLKDWLDENLPALVEGMVEKEIARISRGVK
jgi:cell pole-organizing protein PopZ